jgi:exoribonuclease R
VAIKSAERNLAMDLIEDFMIAANETMAQALKAAKRSCIRRVLKSPERWSRIVDVAGQHNDTLPAEPDSAALNAFLQRRRASDPERYPDLSLAIIKLMGPGEYVLAPGNESTEQSHFALAALDYTHSTAPNRRFPDLVTQRVVKAMLANEPPPYSDTELDALAQHCTERESAARKVERAMQKRVAAVVLENSVGKQFHGVITGASDKGVYVRVFDPPVEGRVVRDEAGLDVGDPVNVVLLHTDPRHAFIDFGRV